MTVGRIPRRFQVLRIKLFPSSFFFLFFFLAFLPKSVYASDLSLICEGTTCTASPSGPLFTEAGIAPGNTFVKSIEVENRKDDVCDLVMGLQRHLDSSSKFESKLYTAVRTGAGDIYGKSSGGEALADKSLSDMFSEGVVSLGVIEKFSTTIFNWIVTFDLGSGNDYQNLKAEFDFDLTFSCLEDDSRSGSPGPAYVPGPFGTGGVSGGEGGVVAGLAVIPGETAGVGTPSGEVGGVAEGGEVAGLQKCNDTLLWILVLLIQLVLTFLIDRLSEDKEALALFGEVVFALLSAFIIWKYFCETWPMFLSIVIGFGGVLSTTFRKKAKR